MFAAMLDSHFAEGQALRNATSEGLPLISLYDDNIDDIIWLCKALYFKPDLTAKINFSLLRELAFLCDKYDLVGVLYPWSHRWLQEWPASSRGVDDLQGNAPDIIRFR